MTLLEELHKEMTQCETELQAHRADLTNTVARIACCEEKKAMLERFIELASAEQGKVDKSKAKQTSTSKPTAARKASRTEDKISTAGANSVENVNTETAATSADTIRDGISIKELAEKIGVATTFIAKTCNELGFNLERIDNKYVLTKEQSDAVVNYLRNSNL